MKLRNWHIEGFGVFSRAVLPEPGLCDGLNLIVGPNEAGKSTLLDFLRYTLFGYPSGNSSLPRRLPLNGGNHGGTLQYEFNGETYDLFRQPTKKDAFELRNHSGTTLTVAELDHHLLGVTPEMFRNIFGFSLEELQGVESYNKAGIRDLVFAASVGRSLQQIRSAQESLAKQANNIYKEGAKATGQNPPRLVKLQHDLTRLRKELVQANAASRAAVGKLNEIENETSRLQEIESRERIVEADIQRVERLISGWPLWVLRCGAEEERERLGDVSLFPPDGGSNFVKLETEFQNTKEQALARLNELRDIEEELRRMPEEFPLLKVASSAEEVGTNQAGYEIAKELAVAARNRAHEAGQTWQTLNEELGNEWREEVIRSFDVSLIAQDEVSRIASEIGDSESIISERYSSASRLAREARHLSRDCTLKARQLQKVEQMELLLEDGEVTRQRNSLRELRSALIKSKSLGDDVERARDHLTQVNLISGQRQPVMTRVPAWLPITLAIIATGLGVSAAILFYAGQPIPAAIITVLALTLIILSIILRLRPNTNSTVDKPLPELLDAKNRYESAKTVYDEHEKKLQFNATALRLGWPVNETELEEWESRIRSSETALNEARELSRQLQELRGKRTAKSNEFRQEKKKLDSARSSYSLMKERWRIFLGERNLPSVEFKTALAVFAKVKEARQTLKQLDTSISEAEKQEQTVQAYLQELLACLSTAHFTTNTDPAICLARFAKLREEILVQEELSEKRSELCRRMRQARESFKKALRNKKRARHALQDMFVKSGVNSEEAFENLSRRFKSHVELSQVIKEKSTGLETIFGHHPIPDELKEAFDPGPRPDWETEKSQRQIERDFLRSRRDESLRKTTTLESEVNAQLKSEEVARLQLECEAMEEEIRQGVQEWLQLATAQELLRRTRQRFELENQAPALAEASRLFRIVTGGDYEKITVPFDSEGADLTISSGLAPALTYKQLSRGTLEQLYLCIRIGYIRQFQKQRGESLPLLMDDVTVNFDPLRMEKAFEILADCCRDGQQILFLTCHDDLIKLLRPGDRCFSMKDFQFERKAVGPLVSTTTA